MINESEKRLENATKNAVVNKASAKLSAVTTQKPKNSKPPKQTLSATTGVKKDLKKDSQFPILTGGGPQSATNLSADRQAQKSVSNESIGSTTQNKEIDLFNFAVSIDNSKRAAAAARAGANDFADDDDDGWESDLNIDISAVATATSRKKSGFAGALGTDAYATACKVLGIVPVSFFANCIGAGTGEVVLKHRGLGPKGAEAIATVLETNTTIAFLDLSDNWIESGGAQLGRSLQINRTLTNLNLSNNRIGLAGASEISEMLGFNGTLRNLNLKGNNFGDKEAIILADGLKQNSALRVLDLSYNKIGDLGALALGTGILQNDGLKELNLAWNQIRVRGANGFFNSVKDNTTITTLNLRDNGICENGQATSLFLSKSDSIISFNISCTRMTDVALISIAKGIEQNYSIKDLDLSDNGVGDIGILALFKAVLASNCIRRVVMRGIKISREARIKFEELKNEKPEVEFVE
ncbi:hypothetical protein HK100_006628 [Physocladia obscura]|uniref:Uncharacterized protein n=1 Tax=Physocladia obscura TaxID=109957 RepID=A0AAD5XII7_9FUNG|nr:hypothetical protein HK100_006628 [Physocladia obscura]